MNSFGNYAPRITYCWRWWIKKGVATAEYIPDALCADGW